MSAEPKILNRARDGLARWQREGLPDRYVPATTMCWFPRKPQYFRARREGCEVPFRCYACPGCREYEAQRLTRRLVETYRATAGPELSGECEETSHKQQSVASRLPRLFAVRIYAPKEKHATMSRRIHRWRGVEIEPGFFRAGVESFVVLARDVGELVARLTKRGTRFHFRPLGKLNRLRSWRDVVRGLIVPRETYGEHIDRWYRRGLAAAEKENWEVEKLGEYQSYDRAKDPRNTSRDLGTLRPPTVWRLSRGVRLRVDSRLRAALSPEKVTELMPELQALVAGIGNSGEKASKPLTPEEIERNRRAYQHVARMETDVVVNAKPSDLPPSPLVGEVPEVLDNSSPVETSPAGAIHSSGAPPPPSRRSIREEAEAVEASEKHRAEFLAQRSNKKVHEAIERLRALVARREKHEDDKS